MQAAMRQGAGAAWQSARRYVWHIAMVVLFIFVTPLIVFNIIQIRKQREIR